MFYLIAQGFKQSKNDYSLFTSRLGSDLIVLLVYVNDKILVDPNFVMLQEIHAMLPVAELGGIFWGGFHPWIP